MNKKIQILDKEAVDRKINRLAWEIYEKNSKENEIVIIGISGRGEILATELSKAIRDISSIKINDLKTNYVYGFKISQIK